MSNDRVHEIENDHFDLDHFDHVIVNNVLRFPKELL